MLELEQQHDLIDLHYNWGEVYDVAVQGHIWTARHRDGATLAAASAYELRELIRSDYAERQRVIQAT